MKLNQMTVFIIEDDESLCEALRYLFESIHLNVKAYLSAPSFLESYTGDQPGCIIIDVRLPAMSGLELLELLNLQKNQLPVIIMTGHGDIQMAVRAMKLGAVDFILKPFHEQSLLDVVHHCLSNTSSAKSPTSIRDRACLLSKREKQIIDLILMGKLNKEMAYELSISTSTVEIHRANIMRKMQAKTSAQLASLYIQSQTQPL